MRYHRSTLKKKGGNIMNNHIRQLRQLKDIAENLDRETTNLIGVLEFIHLGMESLYRTDSSYELSAVNVIQRYLKVIRDKDIAKLNEILENMEQSTQEK